MMDSDFSEVSVETQALSSYSKAMEEPGGFETCASIVYSRTAKKNDNRVARITVRVRLQRSLNVACRREVWRNNGKRQRRKIEVNLLFFRFCIIVVFRVQGYGVASLWSEETSKIVNSTIESTVVSRRLALVLKMSSWPERYHGLSLIPSQIALRPSHLEWIQIWCPMTASLSLKTCCKPWSFHRGKLEECIIDETEFVTVVRGTAVLRLK